MSATRRGHGKDSIYFDQTNGCWVGAVSLGYSPNGKRKRRTVRGRTKTEVRDKLRPCMRISPVMSRLPFLLQPGRLGGFLDRVGQALNRRGGVRPTPPR